MERKLYSKNSFFDRKNAVKFARIINESGIQKHGWLWTPKVGSGFSGYQGATLNQIQGNPSPFLSQQKQELTGAVAPTIG